VKNNIIILGGGQAGIYAAREIRQNDSKSNIKILGEENYYHTKDLLYLKIFC